jgi:hypothetical protein
VKKGMIWCIRNGQSINIWNDRWIPRGFTRQPSSHHGHNLIQWVNELIYPVTGQWDAELVRQIFHEDDVQTILAIPVNEAFEDSIAWHFNKRGIFSVKSAYKVQIDNDSCDQGSSEGAMVYNPLTGNTFPWDKIWKLACPNKVKTFAWRLVHNSLPLKRKIQARGMDIDTRCPVCWRFDEDVCHMLFKCKYAKGVWSELHMENIRLELATLQSPKEVFYCIWDKSEELQLRIIVTLWALSMERNNVNAGERQNSSAQIGSQI